MYGPALRSVTKRYEALHGGGWVAKTSTNSATYFMDSPLIMGLLLI